MKLLEAVKISTRGCSYIILLKLFLQSNTKYLHDLSVCRSHVVLCSVNIFRNWWVLATTAWRVLKLRMEERALIWRTDEHIYCTRRRGQPKRGGLPAWGLGEVLITPHCKIVPFYESFTQKASDLD